MSARAGREGRARRGPVLAALGAAIALVMLAAAGPGLAYVFEVTDAGLPIFWPSLRDNPPGPLQFTYHAPGSTRLGGPLASNSALKSALDDAITRWQQVPTATVRFHPALTSNDTAVLNEGINRVIFTSHNPQDFTGPDGPFIVGLTTTSFIPATGVMVDADMQFNDTSTSFALTLSGRTGSDGTGQRINLKDVVTHETGHALGLDHSHVKGASMYFAATDGATNLTADDAAGLSVLYPAATFRSGTGSISGRVTRNGAPVFGLHVVAVDAVTGQPGVAAFTNRDGTYLMEGVAPGRYVVIGESIKPNALGFFYQDADLTVDRVVVHAASASAPPTVVVVRPTVDTAGVNLRVEDQRVDASNGDTSANAIPIMLGASHARRLVPGSTSRTADFYSFQATRGTTVTLNITAHRLWVPSNPQMEVFDSAGNAVAGPSVDRSTDPADLDDRLVFTPPLEGTRPYVLRVKATRAPGSSFPDQRSIKENESLYLLTTQSVRTNHAPRLVNSAALSNLTTVEAGVDRGGPISVPLSGVVTDDEDPLTALTWVATGVPTDLIQVDATALTAQPPVLRIVPRQFRSGTGSFTLMVFDPDDASASIPVRVSVSAVNDPPALQIDGGSQLARGGPRVVQLDGGGSRPGPVGDSAENSQQMAYSWSQLAGPLPVSSTGASSPLLKVLMRDAGIYRFQLTGTELGGAGLASTMTQDVTIENVAPQARAVAPPVALPGQLVRVRADLTSDANEDLTTGAFQLALLAPAGASVPTTREATAAFAFLAPVQLGRYVFELRATDSGFRELDGARSNPQTARTTFALEVRGPDDLPPTADAGVDRVVSPGEVVALDGRDSIGAAGESLLYSWTVDPQSPAGVTLGNAADPQPTFAAPGTPGLYVFHLVVRGGRTGFSSPRVSTRVRVLPVAGANKHAPVARARVMTGPGGAPPAPGDRILLDGTSSGDPDGSLLAYSWTQTSGPQAALSSNTGSTPSFVPPAPGLYRFRLIATDGQFESRPATVTIPVRPAGAAAQKLLVSARQPGTAATVFAPPQELRFFVDGTTGTLNTVELSARLESGAPVRVVTWEQTAGPRLPLQTSADGSVLTVVPRQARVHTFRASALLSDGQQVEEVVHLLADRATSRVPRAVLPETPALDVIMGAEIELDGTSSRDLPPGLGEEPSSTLVYYWEQEDGPPVVMTQPLAARPVFVPPMSGRYAFRLRVDNQRFGTLSAPSLSALVAEVREKPVQPAATTTTDPVVAPGGHSGGCGMTRSDARASGADGTPWLWLLALAFAAHRRRNTGSPQLDRRDSGR